MESDRVYYQRRTAEERAAAMKSAHPHVRDVHLALAEAYDRRLDDIAALEAPNVVPLIDVA